MRPSGAAVLCLTAVFSAFALRAAPLFETVTVHSATPENRPNFRIPALATAPNGDLLLFTEKRVDGIGDLGDHDLMLARSSDSGRTWSAPHILLDDGRNTCADPTVCLDRERGRIFLFFLKNKAQFAYLSSDDSGVTWRGPILVHSAVTRPEWEQSEPSGRPGTETTGQQRYGVGPGAGGIQLTQGLKKGRLIVPARHREALGGGKSASFSHIILSDDHGETWRLGPTVARHGNECRLEELSDGTVMLNMRNGNTADLPDNSRRLVALSHDGGDTWPTVYRDDALISTTVHAGLRRCVYPSSSSGSLLLFSNPVSPIRQKEHPYGRYNLTVRWSRDEGKTWSAGRVIYPHPSSYSDLTILPDGTIGLVYERGPKDSVHYWDEIQFARFNLEWLFAPPHTILK